MVGCCWVSAVADYPGDFRVMQIPYAEKAARTRESLQVLRAILPGGRVNFDGVNVAIDDGAFFPVVTPVPMLMGGGIRPAPGTGEPQLFEPPLRTLAPILRWMDPRGSTGAYRQWH